MCMKRTNRKTWGRQFHAFYFFHYPYFVIIMRFCVSSGRWRIGIVDKNARMLIEGVGNIRVRKSKKE